METQKTTEAEKEQPAQQTATKSKGHINLNSAFESLNEVDGATENAVAQAAERKVRVKPEVHTGSDKKTGLLSSIKMKIGVLVGGLAAVIAAALVLPNLLSSPSAPATSAPAEVATKTTSGATPQTLPPVEMASTPGAPIPVTPAGIDIERVKGIELQDDLYSDAELIERANAIDLLSSVRPAEKMTCASLGQDADAIFGKLYSGSSKQDINAAGARHYDTYQKRCEAVGHQQYFACAPTGFSWDITVPGCEIGFSAAVALQDRNFVETIQFLPENIKSRMLSILTRT